MLIYCLIFMFGFIFGYWLNVWKSSSCETTPEDVHLKGVHKVVVNCEDDSNFTIVSVKIDGTTTGSIRTFTTYELRDKVNAFHLVKHGKGLEREDKNLLEAIGASRLSCEKHIGGVLYKFEFNIGY